MDYKKLQNGSDIRGVALEGIEGRHINLTEQVCRDIGRGFALWLSRKTGKKNRESAARLAGCGAGGGVCRRCGRGYASTR